MRNHFRLRWLLASNNHGQKPHTRHVHLRSRRRRRLDALPLSVSFIVLVLLGTILFMPNWRLRREDNFDSQVAASASQSRRLSSDDPLENYPTDAFTDEQLKNGAVIMHVLGAIYMFIGLAIVCDEFFVPALEVITETLKLKDDVAGATFMAAGGSAPELFTSFVGTFISRSNVGFGTIIGSAVFNVLFVIGMCAIFSRTILELTWWPLFRDSTYYAVSLCILVAFFFDQEIVWWEALLLFLWYIVYVIIMAYNEKIYRFAERTLARFRGSQKTSQEQQIEASEHAAAEIIASKKKAATSKEPFDEASFDSETEEGKVAPEPCGTAATTTAAATSDQVLRSGQRDGAISFGQSLHHVESGSGYLRTISAFKAGMLRNLLAKHRALDDGRNSEESDDQDRNPSSVSNIDSVGPASDRLRTAAKLVVEMNRYRRLSVHHERSVSEDRRPSGTWLSEDAAAANKARLVEQRKHQLKEVEETKQVLGSISNTNFASAATNEARQSSAKISPMPECQDEGSDPDNAVVNVSHTSNEPPRILESAAGTGGTGENRYIIHPRTEQTTPGNIVDYSANNATAALYTISASGNATANSEEEMEKRTTNPSGGEDQEKRTDTNEDNGGGKADDEGDDGDDDGSLLEWPDSLPKQVWFIVILPLLLITTITIPNVQKASMRKFFLLTFFLSIMWIGAFAYLMVWWATVISEVSGVPDTITGLTFLAAGTSVPDLLSSVIVARQGLGDMAVSSSIGSNIFDILVGLPIPWLSFALINQESIDVGTSGLRFSVVLLIAMLVTVIVTVAWSGWKMTKALGFAMFVLYGIFVALNLLAEYEVFTVF